MKKNDSQISVIKDRMILFLVAKTFYDTVWENLYSKNSFFVEQYTTKSTL